MTVSDIIGRGMNSKTMKFFRSINYRYANVTRTEQNIFSKFDDRTRQMQYASKVFERKISFTPNKVTEILTVKFGVCLVELSQLKEIKKLILMNRGEWRDTPPQ